MTRQDVPPRPPLRIGSLFSGYGGLDTAVQNVVGGELAWYADICRIPTAKNPATHHAPHRGPCAVMAHHHPGIPNLGDVTAVDWTAVERVDVITGGSPCQDLSTAGRRAGMKEGTRSNLWVSMREAIATIRPALVVWENVRGATSAEAVSGLEHCPGCMGDPAHRGPALRALGRVVGDLSDIGYDTRWITLPASDVGAPHERQRVFLAAQPADSPRIRYERGWGTR